MEIFRDLLLLYFFTVYLIPALVIALAELLDDLVGVIAPFAVWISVVNILTQPKSPIGWISLWGVATVWKVGLKRGAHKIVRGIKSYARAAVMPVMFGISAFVIIGAPGTSMNGQPISNGPLGSRKVIRPDRRTVQFFEYALCEITHFCSLHYLSLNRNCLI